MQYSPALGICPLSQCIFAKQRLCITFQHVVAVQAIAMHGGYAAVAMRLGWSMRSRSRKPAGYWDSLPNVRREITAFCGDQVSPSQLSYPLEGMRD